jgi:GAF domain-containing protein
VCEAARELCRADLGVIATRDSATQAMLLRLWPGAPAPPVERIVPGEGLAGQVLLTGRPFRTDDYVHDPRLRNDAQPLTRLEGVEAALAVPIQTEARVEGLLAVYNRSPRPFTDRDEARLTRLASQTAIAIRNAQLLESPRAYQARLEALLDVSHELSRIQPVEELLGAIAAACGEVLESESVGFRLIEGDELVVAGLWGDAQEMMSTRRIKLGESLSGIVASTGAPLRLDDVTDDPRLIPAHRAAVKRLGYRAFLGVPIRVGERVTGVLSIRTRRRPASRRTTRRSPRRSRRRPRPPWRTRACSARSRWPPRRSRGPSRRSCRLRRWTRSAASPAAWLTTSTTC